MGEFSVTIRGLSDIVGFVALAQTQPFTILVGNDYQEVNGKGHIGLCTLDFRQPVRIWSEDCTAEGWQEFCKAAESYVLF